MSTIHFWTLRETAGVEGWDPDADPEQHASGYGHAFLELFVRMRLAGDSVSIGPRVRRGSTCVVVSLEELSEWHRHGLPRMNLALARQLIFHRPALAVIRNDIHPHIAAPYATTLELVPTQASVTAGRRQRYLPLLPQRGLRPRSADRGIRISTVVLKAYRENVPSWTEDVARQLAEQGVTLRIDDQNSNGARGWSDFSDVDAVLCTQLPDTLGDPRRKPATKLVNAWAAGVVPLCEPRIAYQELAHDGDDAVVFEDPAAIAPIVAGLNSDASRLAMLLAASSGRADEFSTSRVIGLWRDALEASTQVSRSKVVLDACLAWVQIAMGERVSAAVRRRLTLAQQGSSVTDDP